MTDKSWMKTLVSRIKKKRNTDLEGFMVIGIDFGTTYSGAAWATLADFESDEINLITAWPGTGRNESKAPTELFYDKHGKVRWGYEIPGNADPVRWFKLLLLRENDIASDIKHSGCLNRARKALRETGKSASDLVADYLRAFWEHILNTVERDRSKTVLDGLAFHVVITVPAIWKDYAREAMKEAARKAGILDWRPVGSTTLSFAPEPEAAALATLCEPGRQVEPGNVYIICDAGGGTVDLISYEVVDLDPIKLSEAVMGTGRLCGGMFIDEAFETMCKNRLGRHWNNLSQTGIREIMKEQWEYAIKPQFTPVDETKEYVVAVPAEAFKHRSAMNDKSRKPYIRNGRIHFQSSGIKKAFGESFHKTKKLIDGQISKANEKGLSITGVILVGGLGSSPYLYQFLKAKLEKDRIEVLQSTGVKPRSAICRGAIFMGFLDGPTVQGVPNAPVQISQPKSTSGSSVRFSIAPSSTISVISTIARKSLGVSYYVEFDADIHLQQDKFWSHVEGKYMAEDQMEWYLKKGGLVVKKEPVRNEFCRVYATADKFSRSFTDEIMQCDDDVPPTRLTQRVQVLCSIRCKVDSKVTFDSLEDYYAKNGRKLKKLRYDIEMVPSGASHKFTIYYKGRKLGSENVNIDFM